MYQLKRAEEIDNFFAEIDKNRINRAARANLNYLPALNYAEPWIGNTEIITMNPTAEAGMPHTRPPNIICMPLYFPESKRQETLAHEYVHVHQRQNKDKWNRFFKKEGWAWIEKYELPERFVERCRLNPDTIDQQFWAWKDRYVPLPLFERDDKPDLRQVTISWYDMETGVRQPEAPRLFLEKYGMPSQIEHPREISAVEIAPFFQTPADIEQYLSR